MKLTGKIIRLYDKDNVIAPAILQTLSVYYRLISVQNTRKNMVVKILIIN